MRKQSNLFTIFLATCLLASAAWAQTHAGTITGMVTDSSGAVVAGAEVKITNVDTNVVRDLVTDSAGLYIAPGLLPGRYRAEVDAKGFGPEAKTGLVLSVGQTLTVGFSLAPGVQNQEITVFGTAQQLIDPTTSTLGQVITEKPVQDLPLNGRNFTSLLPLTAGIAPPPPGSTRYYVNGARGSGTAFLIDGVDVTSPSNDPVRVIPNLEAIGEFKATTNNFDAEYGRALGGVVNAHIRSGTNTLHGSLFEYFRNDVLDARNYFDRAQSPYKYNQFGGSVGGPIIKDKLFVFGDYQGTRIRQSSTILTNVPTLAEDRGDFSDLLRFLPGTSTIDPASRIYDPLTFPRAPFPNNVIPNGRLDPATAFMFSLMPAPNSTGAFNYVVPRGTSEDYNGLDARVDYNPTAKDRLSFVLIYNNQLQVTQPFLGPRLNGNFAGGSDGIRGRDYSVNYTRIISPVMVNELTVGWSRDIRYGDPVPGQEYEKDLGIPGLNATPNDRRFNGFPQLFPIGYTHLGSPLGEPSSQNHNIPQFTDKISWVKGRHSIKTGFSASFRQYNLDQSISTRGFYIFVPQATSSFPANAQAGGNSVASALLGYQFQILKQIVPRFGERIKEYGAFFQDNYKVAKRLSLNLGLRWDLYAPATEQNNHLGDFDPTALTVRLAGKNGNSKSTLDTNWTDFSPHVGFSYQATSDGNTVVRGGYAIGYLNLVTQEVGTADHRLTENPPFVLYSQPVFFGLGPVPPLGVSVPRVSDGFSVAPQDPQKLCCGTTVYYVPKSQPTPYTQQWNLDVQRSLPGNFLLDVAYVGTHGVHLTGITNLNQAPPAPPAAGTPAQRAPLSSNIGEADALLNSRTSNYHALQVRLERRFTSGFYLLGAYTWSHSIDNGSATANGDSPLASSVLPQNSFNLSAERGNSDFDLRHRMVVSAIYELPFGKGKRFLNTASALADGILGGWQVNTIVSAQTGWPFTPRLANGSSLINAGAGGSVRPYLVGNPNLPSGQQSINKWFNVAAFAAPGSQGTPAYTFGTSGRNILRGPDFVNCDFSLFKSFAVTERVKLEFRSEFFNVFNHPNFGLPDQNVDLPTAGIINSAASPRQIQFALKLLF